MCLFWANVAIIEIERGRERRFFKKKGGKEARVVAWARTDGQCTQRVRVRAFLARLARGPNLEAGHGRRGACRSTPSFLLRLASLPLHPPSLLSLFGLVSRHRVGLPAFPYFVVLCGLLDSGRTPALLIYKLNYKTQSVGGLLVCVRIFWVFCFLNTVNIITCHRRRL
jgi:hypothetical protein